MYKPVCAGGMNAATAQPFSQIRISPVSTSIPIPLRPGNSYKLPPVGNSIHSSTGTGKASQPLRPVTYSEVSSKIFPSPSEYNMYGLWFNVISFFNKNFFLTNRRQGFQPLTGFSATPTAVEFNLPLLSDLHKIN